MSINFTGVTGIEDSYGKIIQITDASGRALWSAGPGTVTITIGVSGSGDSCRVGVGGAYYTSAATVEADVGTLIDIYIDAYECDCGDEGGDAYIYHNNVSVGNYDPGGKFYDFNATTNTNIMLYQQSKGKCKDCDGKYIGGRVTITEE